MTKISIKNGKSDGNPVTRDIRIPEKLVVIPFLRGIK